MGRQAFLVAQASSLKERALNLSATLSGWQPDLRPLLWSGDASAVLAPFTFLLAAPIDLGDRLADRFAHPRDLIADPRSPLEIERLGRLEHLGFEFGQILLGDVLSIVGSTDSGIRTRMGRRLSLDAEPDALADRGRCDAMLRVVI